MFWFDSGLSGSKIHAISAHKRIFLHRLLWVGRGKNWWFRAFQDNDQFSIENENIALLRAQIANPDLPRALESIGAIVDDVPVYQTVPETEDLDGAVANLEENGADWITFTSSSTVENFDARFGLVNTINQHGLSTASIGPETTKALKKLGVNPDVESNPHTIADLVETLCQRVN